MLGREQGPLSERPVGIWPSFDSVVGYLGQPPPTISSAKPISEHRTALARTSIPYFDASPLKSERDWKLLFPVPLSGFSSDEGVSDFAPRGRRMGARSACALTSRPRPAPSPAGDALPSPGVPPLAPACPAQCALRQASVVDGSCDRSHSRPRALLVSVRGAGCVDPGGRSRPHPRVARVSRLAPTSAPVVRFSRFLFRIRARRLRFLASLSYPRALLASLAFFRSWCSFGSRMAACPRPAARGAGVSRETFRSPCSLTADLARRRRECFT